MPRITAVKVAAFDSVQGVSDDARLDITRFYRSDIARAVEEDHYCNDDSTCDIAAALSLDLPLVAAGILSGATECAHLDATLWAHRFNRTISAANDPGRDWYATEDWEPWGRWFDSHALMCAGCGGATFGTDHWTPEECGHCGEAFITAEDRETFIRGYVECALWSESIGEDFAKQWVRDHPNESEPAPDVSLESFGFTADDITAEALDSIEWDCNEFISGAIRDVLAYTRERSYRDAGHDFWLTRNGHGAGFWDRGLGELGDRLTAEAKPYSEANLYVGDDGKVYYS